MSSTTTRPGAAKPEVLHSLTGGRTEGAFDQILTSLQGYGFRQTIFELEAEDDPGTVILLRPSSMQPPYPLVRPGDRVHWNGEAGGAKTIYRIRRMADGFSRNTMTERTRQEGEPSHVR